jgi:hypothetical protein
VRDRIALWKRIFESDANAITQQVSKLAWDLAAYSCLVEVVRLAPEGRSGRQLNGMFMDMLASGFWSTTMQGVRKLAERETIHGPRGVCSIGGLLQDVRAARPRLTRRVFVEDIAQTAYNHRETEHRYMQWLFAGVPGVARWAPSELRYEVAQQRHELFDRLSGTTPGTSSPDDLIRDEVFVRLEERLQRLHGVVEHVNVNVAHAATEASRSGRTLQQWNLADAKAAVRELAQIAEVVGSLFSFSGVGMVLPVPQFDQFEHLDQPLFNGDTAGLGAIWDALSDEMSRWHETAFADLLH